MRIVKVSIELVIGDHIGISQEDIAAYLNDRLYSDPEFFWRFWPRKYCGS